MKPTDLTAFRTALRNKRAELTGRQNREYLTIEDSPDEMDRIQNANDRDYAISGMERDASRLQDVTSALARIDADTFGLCFTCEEPISPKRLAAIPWALRCISCQEATDNEIQMSPGGFEDSLVQAA